MFDIFEFVAQGIVLVLFIVFVLVISFGLWMLWQARTATKTAVKAIRQSWEQTKQDSYTREELYRIIAHHELRGDMKAVDYWTEILDRKYPHA